MKFERNKELARTHNTDVAVTVQNQKILVATYHVMCRSRECTGDEFVVLGVAAKSREIIRVGYMLRESLIANQKIGEIDLR